MTHRVADSSLGPIVLTTDEAGALTGLWFAGQRHFPSPEILGARDDTVAEDALQQFREYLDGTRRDFDVPLAPRGTAFQQRVWAALRDIPYGETTTYGQLAASLGSSPRAVGNAVGRNPISVIVPCHRVIAGDGSLTGYAGGLDKKGALLARERDNARGCSHG